MICHQDVSWSAEQPTVVGTKIVAPPPAIKCIILMLLFFWGGELLHKIEMRLEERRGEEVEEN